MNVERDRVRAPWDWLRGFAWLLLAWPLLSLTAADQFDFADWGTILVAMLGPAAVGLVLLLVQWLLDRMLRKAVAAAGQPVPSTLRDLSNLGLTLAILMVVDVALVTAFEEKNLFTRPELDAGPIAAWMLAGCFGGSLVFRGLHWVAYGRARHEDMGEGWDHAPNVLRFLGYLTLVPTLLVCTVMIDYALRSKPDFGVVAWICLPALMLLGLRSAMARSPRYWARNPWEAWLRRLSLSMPWWLIALALAVGTAVMFILLPTVLLGDDEITMVGRVIAGVLMVPMGVAVLYLVAVTLRRELPRLARRLGVALRLARDPSALLHWEVRESPQEGKGLPEKDVRIRLRGGQWALFPADAEPLEAWLRTQAPRHGD